MKFDIFTDEQPSMANANTHERVDVPEGEHELQIKQILESDEQLKVRLVHPDRRYGWVFCNIKKGQQQSEILGNELGRALGMNRQEWLGCEVGDLVGRRVRAEIRHRVDNNGRLWVNVWRFMEPGPEPQPAPEPKPRATPAQRIAETAQFEKDDIPF